MRIALLAMAVGVVGCKRADCPALLEATRQGDGSRIETLLSKHTPVNCTDAQGHTPLHVAAMAGKVNAAAVLIDNGGALEQSDADQRTPLCEAAKHSHADVAQLLIAKGANIEGHCRGVAFTALHIAAGADATEVIKVLLASHAKVSARNVWDQTPLHQAATEGSGIEAARLLLETGAELEIHDNNGFTPLATAARGRKPQLVQFLLDAGANPNTTTNNGHTVLDLSARWPEVAEIVKAKGGRPGAVAALPPTRVE